ncbi:DUF1642 domain-containing protein, partial [Jeotgalibaca porci]|uniref:DUF1642 domain-containing protein n=1 Tax=Jeotgalibaca porci TaxID=1868793 RepID=UPI00359F1929
MKIENLQKGQKILVECEFDSFAGANQAWVLIQGEAELAQLDDIKPNQPKPVVPQFVAEWYEEHKDKLEEELCYQIWLIRESGAETDFEYWLTETENPIKTLINMHQFGYTVEKEKLYTVEIPNPNGCNLYLIKLDKEVVITSDVIADVFPDNL